MSIGEQIERDKRWLIASLRSALYHANENKLDACKTSVDAAILYLKNIAVLTAEKGQDENSRCM